MEVRSTRTQEIRLYKFDEPEVNIRYTGRSDSMLAADSDPVWQIMREYRIADQTIIEYAHKGSFTAKWSDRVSYFPVAIPDPTQPLSGISITGSITGTFTPTGLTIAGLITTVTIDDASWTALPATAQPNRNQLNIQNVSGVEIKIQYDPLTAGYIGVTIADGSERQYAIRDTIVIYAKAAPGSGSVDIQVEELA